MAQWSSYVQLLVLLGPVISLCESAEYFIRPPTLPTNASCPGQPCLTINQYMNYTSYCVQSNTTLTFLPGNHVLKRPVQIQNVKNVTLKSTTADTYPPLLVQYSCENCSNIQSAIELINVTNMVVKGISLEILTPNVSGVIVELSTNVYLQLDIHYVSDNNTYGTAVLANETCRLYMDRIRVGNFYDGIRTENTNEVYITNTTLENCQASGVVLNKSNTVEISDTVISDNMDIGMFLFECSNINMGNVTAANNREDGMHFESCNNTTMTTMITTYNQRNGMHFESCNNTTLTTMITTYNQRDGMHFESCNKTTLTGIYAKSNQNGIYLFECSNINVTNVSATNNQEDGMRLISCNNTNLTAIYARSNIISGIFFFKCSNINVTNVSATNNEWDGVSLMSCNNTNLTNINATDNQVSGMYLDFCNDATLTGINATTNQLGMTFKHCSNVSLTRIYAANSEWYGVNFQSCNNTTLTNMNATSNKNGVILKDCSNITLTSIHATKNKEMGLSFSSCIDTSLINAYATNNQENGVDMVSCRNTTLTNTTATYNQRDGMDLNRCGNVTITNISATNNQIREMNLYLCSNVNMTNISITNNQLNGMYFLNNTSNADLIHNGIFLQNNNDIRLEYSVFSDTFALSTLNIATEPYTVPAVIELNNSTLIVSNCNFTGNDITSIKAIGSKVIVEEEVIFSDNRALSGAALLFVSDSVLVISETSRVTFHNNQAVNYGGAIYILTDEVYDESMSIEDVHYSLSPSLVTPSTTCFLSIEGDRTQARLIFTNNTAGKGGDVVYGGLVALGYDGDWNCLHSFKNVSDMSQQNGLSVISSAPSRVCLCHDGEPDCLSVADPKSYTIYPGETITVPAVVVGQDFGTVTGSVVAQFLQNYTTCSMHLEKGQQSIFVDNDKCADLEYTLYASGSENCTAILTLQTNNAEVFEPMTTDDNGKVNYSWAILNEEPNYHELASRILSEAITVNKHGQTLTPYYSEMHMHTIKNFLKFSKDAQCLNSKSGMCEIAKSVKFVFPNEIYSYPTFINISFKSCPLGFSLSKIRPFEFKCDCNHLLQQMPQVKCDIQRQTISRDGLVWVGTYHGNETVAASKYCPYNYCKSTHTQITLTEQESDQCNQHHSGVLCGGCQPGLSLALGTNRCLPCSNVYISLLLPFAIAGLLLVFFIKFLDLTISQGTMNELIFYVNVVSANKYLYYSQTNVNPITLFIAWFNLDIGIETCFFNGLTAYSRTWLQFVFPLYIWAIAGVIIIIAKYSDRVAKVMGKNGVPVLATLFLLSYAKLFNTIITAMSFTTLYTTQGQKLVWSADGNVDYLGPKHIPLFCVALVALVFLWAPYTLLLLLGQWLHRLNCHIITRTLLKLKPFLDAHFAAFKDKHRYWFGLLLLVRAVNVLISASTPDNTTGIVEFSTAILSILLTFWGQNVYCSSAVGKFGTAFLLNLAIMNVTKMFSNNSNGSITVASFTLIAIAFTQFLGLIFYKVLKYRRKMTAWCVREKQVADDWELYELAALKREMELESEMDRETNESGSIESFLTYGI